MDKKSVIFSTSGATDVHRYKELLAGEFRNLLKTEVQRATAAEKSIVEDFASKYDTLSDMISEKTSDNRVVWGVDSSIDDYCTAGNYGIVGYRVSPDDGLPIDNYGDFQGVAARLIVTDSGIADTLQQNRIVGQTLILSNRLGGETKIYTRSRNYSSGLSEWTSWRVMQGVCEVGAVTPETVDTFIDNGIYTGAVLSSGVHPLVSGSVFLLVTVNNSSVVSALGNILPVSCAQMLFILPCSADVSSPNEVRLYLRTGVRPMGNSAYSFKEWKEICSDNLDERVSQLEERVQSLLEK